MPSSRRAAGAVFAATQLVLVASCTPDPSDSAQDGIDSVRVLLDATHRPDRLDGRGNALLHVASMRRDPEMLSAVLKHGASVDLRNAGGLTALGIAADNGCLACALELLDAHADPNVPQGPDALRPLHIASLRGTVEMVRLLLSFGADPNGRDAKDESPLHAASGADMYRAIVVTKLLVDHGAQPGAVDRVGETPLHRAAEREATDVIAYYASLGADLDATNVWGATPLDRAVDTYHDRAADLLYRLGAHAKLTPHFEPPLVQAARVNDTNRTRWLLAYGASPDEQFDGRSALDIARASGSQGVVALMLARSDARR